MSWGTLALINAGLAQGKRRSGVAWFVVSLFLGPLATFLIVVTDSTSGFDPVGPSGKLFGLQLPWRKHA